jgi:hypothetical protein
LSCSAKFFSSASPWIRREVLPEYGPSTSS